MEDLLVVESTSFAELASENGIKFGENYAKLPLGEMKITFTKNLKKQKNRFFDNLTNEQKENASEFNLLAECTIVTFKGSGNSYKETVVSNGFLRINSALKKCEPEKKYLVKTILGSFEKEDDNGDKVAQPYNKVVFSEEIE